MKSRSEKYLNIKKVTSATAIGVLGFLTLSCGSESSLDSSPASASDREFIQKSGATTAYTGDMRKVGILPQQLKDDYGDYPVYEHGNEWDTNFENKISFKPRRFKTGFRQGDGSGADSVCEDLAVPDGTKYIQAVTDSTSPAWVAYNANDGEVHLCYKASSNPDNVAVWAGNDDR